MMLEGNNGAIDLLEITRIIKKAFNSNSNFNDVWYLVNQLQHTVWHVALKFEFK